MRAQGSIAAGEVLAGVAAEVAEGGGKAVGPMFEWRATDRSQGVLQTLGQGDIALAAEHDMGMLEA